MRYRLQFKEATTHPYVIGNHSFPYQTYIWKDLAISNDLEALEKHLEKYLHTIAPAYRERFRIEDTGERE
jgi:uncharacterized protein Usg